MPQKKIIDSLDKCNTPTDVRKYIAYLASKVQSGEMGTTQGRLLNIMAENYLKSYRIDEQDKAIADLAKKIEKGNITTGGNPVDPISFLEAYRNQGEDNGR